MADYFLIGFILLLAAAFALYVLNGIVVHFIEPVFMSVFHRPLFVFFHPFPKSMQPREKAILLSGFPFYKRLDDRKKRYFEHRVSVFLSKYPFHAKGGQVITDEVRILISATYVMLTFGMRNYLISAFNKIIVYPDVYHSTISDSAHKGEFNPQVKAVVFSWNHFVAGLDSAQDNINLGIHEFAHALHFNGMKRTDNAAAKFAEMYNKIIRDVRHPANAIKLTESSYFRNYAFTNEFEFVAVILEHFFETPGEFRREFPVLYDKVSMMINVRH